MFFFNRSKSSYNDFSAIATDMHSHLIPGVDDGAKDIADSLQLIKGLSELGFTKLYTTPHTLQDIHPNTSETLKNGHAQLDGKLPHGMTLNLSSEYYLDEEFKKQLTSNQLIPLPGNRLLVEFSQIFRPHDLEEVIFDIGIKGYQVILAHPERYLFFHKQFNYYTRLKEMGIEFQVNAMSLTEHYGKGIKSIAEKLIEKGMIDFIGTDIHHVKHLDVLKKVPSTKHYAKLVDSGLLKNTELN
ncbi:tyrosine-protein phosphatase [Pedobacter nyackensis]|uniref:tyrosine-protein phosphatase n=1 Tax=Pedobacter nyackensis TaxID=475255 RepID=UPI0029302558|nr:CpsB/CapC family capsule biosynthesis tyrosine phosphatase [Pedobacter nyackensis]